MESEGTRGVGEWIRKEVNDWESEVMVSARFKAFSGQRSDWEPRYLFWRDLIIKIARHLRLVIIHPSEIKNVWFNRGGLTPLCIDRVLLEMYNAGDLLCSSDLVDPKSSHLTQLFQKVRHLLPLSKSATPSEDELIVTTLLEEKSVEVLKFISDNYWISSCIITMSKFQVICGGPKEATAVLSYLSKCGKAKYLALKRKDLVEGVKVSLSPKTICGTTHLDYNVLHLTWTAEKLQLQLDVINHRHDKSKISALASLNSGNKTSALRHARELKLASQNREKCNALLRRVEEVLQAIADAEDSKEILEAIQIGTKAIKDNNITIEEVQLCLEELDETISLQKQVEKVIGSTLSFAEFGDEDIEDELNKLQLEDGSKSSQVPVSKIIAADGEVGEQEISETTKSLSKALSNLKLVDDVAVKSVMPESAEPSNVSKDLELEAS